MATGAVETTATDSFAGTAVGALRQNGLRYAVGGDYPAGALVAFAKCEGPK